MPAVKHIGSDCHTIYMNDGIRICAQACSCCWDKTIPEDYEGQVNYLARRCKTGHTSVLEHSNLIVLYRFPNTLVSREDIIQLQTAIGFLGNNRYLNTVARMPKNGGGPCILIGGSYRGFDDVYHSVSDSAHNYGMLKLITEQLYQHVNSMMFHDLTDGDTPILNKDSFLDVEPDAVSDYFNPIGTNLYEDDKVKFISIDNIEQIKRNVDRISPNTFSIDDIAKVASTTILFKDMSRTGTHQLVRHRNGITQESQRYVDYSHAAFADPLAFKPEKYDVDKKYDFEFGGQKFSMTSMELGESIIGIYHYLIDQGMMKEDARSFLPGNVKCRRLYMTFTYKTLLKFFELRCHPAAQAEIRSFAMSARKGFEIETEKFKVEPDKNTGVDEIISDKEVIMEKIIENTPELNKEEKEND